MRDEPPYLFLDFDGVLNSEDFFARNPEARGDNALDRKAIRRLNDFVGTTNCYIVISSTWRYGRDIQELRGILVQRGFVAPKRIIGKTPEIDMSRGKEIARYLSKSPDVFKPPMRCSYVIFDDDTDMEPVRGRHVHIDPMVGLQRRDLERAYEILRIRR